MEEESSKQEGGRIGGRMAWDPDSVREVDIYVDVFVSFLNFTIRLFLSNWLITCVILYNLNSHLMPAIGHFFIFVFSLFWRVAFFFFVPFFKKQ